MEIDEYSIHSPFVYDLYIHVILPAKKKSATGPIEDLRKSSYKNNTCVTTGILGASSKGSPRREKIGRIARKGISTGRYTRLYQGLIRHFGVSVAVELGTSIGITTLSLAHSCQGCMFYTFEGNPSLCGEARKNFSLFPEANIKIVEGDIDSTLPVFAEGNTRPGFMLVDANHRFIPTMRYYKILKGIRAENSVMVIDDIHRSSEMERAWNEIRKDPDVRIDLDLFQAGVLIFMGNLPKISLRLNF